MHKPSVVKSKPVLLLSVAFLCCAMRASSSKAVSGEQPAATNQMKSNRLPSKENFFPVSVWYGGGKARAPMLETITPDSPRLWNDDLNKIKSLGFNTVRTWVEW